jgi:asparagine synthase (glutamine-hydrolysing)
MCGIVGIWNAAVEQPAHRVGAMLAAMRHRGPDGNGRLDYVRGAAGMVRLALVDLSERGQQPMWSPDRKVAILFNGEVYNFRQERSRLEALGHQFRTTTDTEVVLHLYLEQGIEFVQRLRGMYAIAIFDWRQSGDAAAPTLLLVRDPLGIKPLYISAAEGQSNSVVFSSELRALLASGLVPRRIDQRGLVDYLAYGFLPQPQTMIEGVRMMQAGTWERYVPGKPVERKTFWRMPPYEPRQESFDEASERLRAVLNESVRLHALADAPIGAFLSGGIDSTAIVGLMREHVPHLRTYTLKYADVPGYDESDEAEDAAKRFGCRNTVVELTGREIAPLLPSFAADLDQPSVDGLNTWLVSRAAAEDVTGVLSGLGGDEWFAGYPVARRMSRYQQSMSGRLQALAGRFAHVVAPVVPGKGLRQRAENLATRRSLLTTWMQTHRVLPRRLAERLVGGTAPSAELEFEGTLARENAAWQGETPVGLACLLDAEVYMRSQLLRDSDATSMAHSLELRVPFVDLEIAQFARTCQDEYKLRPDGGDDGRYQASGAKRVLIHAIRDVLPPEIAKRPKRGFALPIDHWMRKDWADVVSATCSAGAISARGLIDCNEAAKLLAAGERGEAGAAFPKLWSLVLFELWCQGVIDQKVNHNASELPLAT